MTKIRKNLKIEHDDLKKIIKNIIKVNTNIL